MPVKILSGGGKSTKDATAIPGDVRSGKTFYGADGKQTGIWTPKVTDYTMDATLQPENAPLGEVFYNNLGRQVGKAPIEKRIVLAHPGGSNSTVSNLYGLNVVYLNSDYSIQSLDQWNRSIDFTFLNKMSQQKSVTLNDFDYLIINDKKVFVSFPKYEADYNFDKFLIMIDTNIPILFMERTSKGKDYCLFKTASKYKVELCYMEG